LSLQNTSLKDVAPADLSLSTYIEKYENGGLALFILGYGNEEPSDKAACFDMDFTLIKPKM